MNNYLGGGSGGDFELEEGGGVDAGVDADLGAAGGVDRDGGLYSGVGGDQRGDGVAGAGFLTVPFSTMKKKFSVEI